MHLNCRLLKLGIIKYKTCNIRGYNVLYNMLQFDVKSLRCQVADYLRKNRDEFLPFLIKEGTEDTYNEGRIFILVFTFHCW